MMFEHLQNAGDAIEARLTSRVRVKAGARPVSVAFVRYLPLGDTRRVQQFLRSSVDTLDWTGLPHPVGHDQRSSMPAVLATPSRTRIFTCRPTAPTQELSCARRILATLARRAYRQPVDEEDLRPLIEFYQSAGREGSFETGIQRALRPCWRVRALLPHRARSRAPACRSRLCHQRRGACLASLLLPVEQHPGRGIDGRGGQPHPHTPAVLDQQVRRMLADRKSLALVDNFAGQWLQLRNVRSILPNSDEFLD